MAKRAPIGEEPYRPLLDPGVLSAALTKASPATAQGHAQPEIQPAVTKVVEIIRPEPLRHQGTSYPVAPEPQTQRGQVGEGRAPAVAPELVEKFDQEKRMLLTRSESAALDRLVGSLAGRLNTQVKLSHVLRSLVSLLLNAEDEVDKRAGETGGLIRPPNGDGKALQKFEMEIARVLGAAIRDAGPLR